MSAGIRSGTGRAVAEIPRLLLVTTTVPATYAWRRRVKGWRKPAGGIVCTRPSRWSNPFAVGERIPTGGVIETNEQAVAMYRRWLRGRPDRIGQALTELAGGVLLCYCKPGERCHVQDVLIPLVNDGRLP